MQKYTTTIEAQNNAFLTQLVGAQVSIYNFGTTTLATIYSDNGVTLATNPLTSDANGQISFYAANGHYSYTASKAGYSSVSVTDILLFDPASPYAGVFTTLQVSGNATVGSLLGSSTISQINSQDINTLAGNTSVAVAKPMSNGGIVVIRDVTDGGTALFLMEGNGGSSIVAQTASNFSVTDTGASTSKICVLYSGGDLTIYNRYGTAKRIAFWTIGAHN